MKSLFLALLMLTGLGACAAGTVKGGGEVESFQADSRPLGKTLVYECGEVDLIARLGPGEMAVWLEDRYLILSQVRSASGSRYQEADISFWSKGDEARLEVAGKRYPNCRLAPARAPWEDARRRGVDFRAAGNEPGWYLELQSGRQILYVGDYGMDRVMTPVPQAYREGKTRIYHAVTEAAELVLEITDEDCVDSMKGDTYPSRVDLLVNGKNYQGCGMDLVSPWE